MTLYRPRDDRMIAGVCSGNRPPLQHRSHDRANRLRGQPVPPGPADLDLPRRLAAHAGRGHDPRLIIDEPLSRYD